GATAIAGGAHAKEDDLRIARELFEAVGRVVVLDESLLDAVTGLSGSGPAYVMLIIEALADGGVKVGLHRDTALLLAAQTVFGSALLLLETGKHPGRLKDMVTSPGGTAIAGLHTLESGALRKTLIDAVEVASKLAARFPFRDRGVDGNELATAATTGTKKRRRLGRDPDRRDPACAPLARGARDARHSAARRGDPPRDPGLAHGRGRPLGGPLRRGHRKDLRGREGHHRPGDGVPWLHHHRRSALSRALPQGKAARHPPAAERPGRRQPGAGRARH